MNEILEVLGGWEAPSLLVLATAILLDRYLRSERSKPPPTTMDTECRIAMNSVTTSLNRIEKGLHDNEARLEGQNNILTRILALVEGRHH